MAAPHRRHDPVRRRVDASAAAFWSARRSGSTPRRCSPRSCSSAPSRRRWRPARTSSRGPGPTPGRWRGSRFRGSARARSCSPARAGRRSPSGPATSSARRRPASRGTAVYSAHRDTHFAFLGEVAIGDEIRVTRRDGRHVRFRVTGTSVVRWDASGIDPLAAGRGLALVTCWPLDATFSGPLRYVVHRRRTIGALP